MNVIVANKKANDLSNLNVDIIKSLNGEYDVNVCGSVSSSSNVSINFPIIECSLVPIR